MDMPPSRYKVVEKGRRLVVVDRLTGEQVRQQIRETPQHRSDQNYAPPPPAPGPSARPPMTGAGRTFTTQSWYDNRAPRTLDLNDDKLGTLMVVGGVAVCLALLAFFLFSFFPLFVVAFILLQKGPRAALRRGATAWLDGLAQI